MVCVVLVAIPVSLIARAAPGTDGPPPTPVPPDGRLSPFPQSLNTPQDASRPPVIDAAGAILADLSTGAILYEHAADVPRPIASLTKVMTTLLVLERTSLDDVVQVDANAVYDEDDYGAGSTLGLRAGERRTVEELLAGVMLGSANDAAEALAIHVSGSVEAFVRDMNRRAAALGMRQTEFHSPHGLDDRGRSTPRDLVRLVRAANQIDAFRRLAALRFATIGSPAGPDRRIQNRNALLWLYPGAVGTKTGMTAGAGPSLIGSATREGRDLVAIVLNADGEAFSPVAALLNHGFTAFDQKVLVERGQMMGEAAVIGGSVPAFAGADLQGLVAAGADVRFEVTVDPDAAFPPAQGEPIGTITVLVDGREAGGVPLVAGSPPSPAGQDGAWWLRAAGAVTGAVADAVDALIG